MGKFIAGILVGLVIVAAGAYVYIHHGFIHMQADQPVTRLEQVYLNDATDNYVHRYAPKAQNPMPPTDANLMDGIRIYKSNCAVCHGGPVKPVSEVGAGLYPPAPQFVREPPDMADHLNYWIVKHGIARTGMPAWDKALSDADIWKVTTFLGKMAELDKLSPAVQQEWKTGGQAEVGAQQNPTGPAAQPQPAGPAMPAPENKGSQQTH